LNFSWITFFFFWGINNFFILHFEGGKKIAPSQNFAILWNCLDTNTCLDWIIWFCCCFHESIMIYHLNFDRTQNTKIE
jgi:cytosine/uracil/thiamine/allantoin permease